MIKYVWLNLNTGEFSNSWNEESQKHLNAKDLEGAKKSHWKCIKYECVNDSFQFNKNMKIVTNLKKEDKQVTRA